MGVPGPRQKGSFPEGPEEPEEDSDTQLWMGKAAPAVAVDSCLTCE